MAAAKKKKELTFRGKPIYRSGNTIYYGNLEDRLILVMNILETEKAGNYEKSKKIVFHIQDNSGELGKGTNYRTGEREDLYKALDIGSWWLQDALEV